MIVQIRGTGGSGKSTIVRAAMGLCQSQTPIFADKRRQPIGYKLNTGGRGLFVPGHYETACGGCDTVKTTDEVYALVSEYHDVGFDVLHEGIMISDDTRRAVELNRRITQGEEILNRGFVVIHLDPSIDLCLAGIQARRDAKGNTEELNPKNTVERAKRIRRHCVRLRDAGVRVLKFTDREEAKAEVLRLLGLAAS